ncbi:hydroxymethylbilane synthase [Haematomicrobium sanguinis]|uniref:hydroxymethylbilane synthase n=1 Tax=Haematomicrobium sanguinis TaxID=479106 RepID=UPI000552FE03|nr:hydroxymethylbilane synthase [Haematomicrobium sanguinis]
MSSASNADKGVIRIGTRGSKLAVAQSGMVAREVEAILGVPCELVTIKTDGDVLTGSLANLGGTGVFVAALRQAVLDGRVDIAVHSLKDMPTADAPGLVIAATPKRADPRDALCARDGLTLAELPTDASVGTGSPRRVSQLKAFRKDLETHDIRGNVDTRLAKVRASSTAQASHENGGEGTGVLDAVVLACAGLDRVGLAEAITERIDPAVMLPAPGQGALALETRADSELARALAAYDDAPTRLAVTAERALLAALEAGCAAPVGALGTFADGQLHLEAVAGTLDGTTMLRHAMSQAVSSREQARALGYELAEFLLEAGADQLPGVRTSSDSGD